MTAPNPSLLRWARSWQTAGEFLERERATRLRNMTDDDARAAIAAIFQGASPPVGPARECGLVEQQRLFRKLR